MLPYNSFREMYPPRPENASPPSSIGSYEGREFIAQPKLDGSCMLVSTNGIDTHVRNRHKEPFKNKIPIMNSLQSLHRTRIHETSNNHDWMVLVGEYMNKSKADETGKPWNSKLVLFDIIVFGGKQLIGTTFEERIALLDELYGTSDLEVTPGGIKHHKYLYTTPVKNVYRVKSFRGNFRNLWNDVTRTQMFEGLILKLANAKLENCIGVKNNSASQVKFRRQTKNYTY